MGLLNIVGKLGNILVKPIEVLTDWAQEPLRRWEYNRKELSADNELRRTIELKTAEHRIFSDIQMRQKEHEVNLNIKKETEVAKIFFEIEELKKDKQFKRMKDVSEAIISFQKELTKLNVDAITAIGEMQLDLREKAQNMVYEKTLRYKNLQKEAFNEAANELKQIEADFEGNDDAKAILQKAIELRLCNLINTAHNFLLELNNDIKQLNNSISLLAENGQKFIESHLGQFHLIGMSEEEIKLLNK